MTREPDMPANGGEPLPNAATGDEPAPVTSQGPAEVTGPAGAPGAGQPRRKSAAREWLETIIVALLFALLIRAFVVQVYLVEGESMEPTLHTAERLLVNKFVYRFRSPQAGEIIVLQDPGRPSRELIKRVVAVAGETVEVKRGVVYVNGKPMHEPYKNTEYTQYADVPATPVPEGSIYVMGDNRGRSFDSRMIGPIPRDRVDGKAFFRFWPLPRFAAGQLQYPRTYEQTTGSTK